jgi:hypothetical protein
VCAKRPVLKLRCTQRLPYRHLNGIELVVASHLFHGAAAVVFKDDY